MTRCKAPHTIDREGGDCADPTCRAHDINEDGPHPPRPTMPCGCDGAATQHDCRESRPMRNPDHDTACRCSGCLADPYIDPAGPAVPARYAVEQAGRAARGKDHDRGPWCTRFGCIHP